MNKIELMTEKIKCTLDPVYYAETYCKVFDVTNSGFVPFEMFERQKELMKNLMEHSKNLVAKPRQAGVSTVSSLYAATQILFSTEKFPQRILIIANKQDTAQEFLTKIKGFIKFCPPGFGVKIASESKGIITLTNGSSAKAVATSEDALRGYTPTQLIMDEAAFIEGGKDVWAAALPALSTGGRAIFISTPNGKDPLYYETYKNSKAGKNTFKITELRWYEDPRFNKDLEWIRKNKDGDDSKDEKVIEMTISNFKGLLAEGFKPTSSWYRMMCADLNEDKVKIAQELDVSFVGSGDNVIDEEYISFQENNYIIDPIRTIGGDKALHIWKEPVEDHNYILSCDVGSGSAADYSAFIIHDVDTGEQVAEYHGKCKADDLGVMINDWGGVYNNAYVIIDITGGYGNPTLLMLNSLEYPNIHFSTQTAETFEKAKRIDPNAQKSKPGFWFTNQNRQSVTHEFEKAVRTKSVKIRSARIIDEMRNYIYKNGRPDHQSGSHDDLIMSYAMCVYTLERNFKEIEKAREQQIKLLNAIKTSADFDDEITPASHHQYDQFSTAPTPELTKKYSWLFG